MKASVVISQTEAIYHSEDIVSGYVLLTAVPGSTIRKVTIELGGTARTIAGGVSPYNETVVLFNRNQALYEGPEVVAPGNHQWPFEFTIPRTCHPHESQRAFSKKDTFFYGSASQSLPPTFQDTANSRLISAINSIGDESATIAYHLKASFFSSQDNDAKGETVTVPLNIQPRRELEHPTWDTATHICKFNIPLNGRRRSSLTNIFISRKADNRDNQDGVEFTLRARMATTLVVGKPIPIFLLLEHEIVEETTGPRAAFSIRSATLTLVSKTSIRGHSPIRVQHPTGECQTEWDTAKQIGSKLNYSVAIQSGGILDLRSLISDLVVPKSQAPSFTTFNIVHIHHMKLKVVLMYQDRSFMASFVVKRVIVLPPTHKPSPSTEQAEVSLENRPIDEPLRRNSTTATASAPSSQPIPESTPAFSKETTPAPGTIAAFSSYRLRQSVDEDLDIHPAQQPASHGPAQLTPLFEEPPPFESAVSNTQSSHESTQLATQAQAPAHAHAQARETPSEDPPSFASVAASQPSSRQHSIFTEYRPSFETVSSSSRRASLARLPFDEPPPFEGVGEEELPSYAREETY